MLTQHPARQSPKQPGKISLAGVLSRVKVVNHLDQEAIDHLFPLAKKAIGAIADPIEVARVARRNADSIWLFSRTDGDRPEGFQAFLLLNKEAAGSFSTRRWIWRRRRTTASWGSPNGLR